MFTYTCIYKIVYCLATALKIILIFAILKVNISDALVFAFILRLSVCLLVIQPIDLLWRFRQLMSHIKASTIKLERRKGH